MLKSLLALTVVVTMSGCASIMNDSMHPIKVETKTVDGTVVQGADCTLTNDFGSVTMHSGETAQVHRSGKDMDIVCKMPSNPNAQARAISRANAGMFGNIILGGGIGALIDHNKGTAYTYPTWMQLVFGETLVFDRMSEKDGAPALGAKPVVKASASGT